MCMADVGFRVGSFKKMKRFEHNKRPCNKSGVAWIASEHVLNKLFNPIFWMEQDEKRVDEKEGKDDWNILKVITFN